MRVVRTSDPTPVVSTEPLVLQDAAVRAVTYADVFDYPLRAAEIHQYLHGVVASWADTLAALEDCVGPGGPLSCRDGFYTLQGRESIVPLRVARSTNAKRLWIDAVRYGRLIAQLPFVRLVAVTGSLAWDNVDGQGDIDYLVISKNGRLWLCRAFIAVLARIARRAGVSVCVNYMLSERTLALSERDLYTAYELVRTKPIAGLAVYQEMRKLNAWTRGHLPNVPEPGPVVPAEALSRPGRMARLLLRTAGLAGWVLRSPLGTMLEWVEMRRARRVRLRVPRREQGEISYTPDCYKAHRAAHKGHALSAFAERMEALKGSVG